MWIRRSDTEIEQLKRRQRFSPLGALVIITFVMFLLLFLRHDSEPINWNIFVIVFLLCFALLYISHVLVGRYLLPLPGASYGAPRRLIRNMICTRCRTIQLEEDSRTCQCGGQLEPLDYWRWVEDDKAQERSAI
jgi:hypothetical protein